MRIAPLRMPDGRAAAAPRAGRELGSIVGRPEAKLRRLNGAVN
jgi:hypothetical protein